MSSLAIKCLPPLVKGASERAAEEVINGLCDKLATTGKDQQQQRDVGTIGLKTVVADLGRTRSSVHTCHHFRRSTSLGFN